MATKKATKKVVKKKTIKMDYKAETANLVKKICECKKLTDFYSGGESVSLKNNVGWFDRIYVNDSSNYVCLYSNKDIEVSASLCKDEIEISFKINLASEAKVSDKLVFELFEEAYGYVLDYKKGVDKIAKIGEEVDSLNEKANEIIETMHI